MNEVRQLAVDGGVGSPFSVSHDVQVNPKGARMNGAPQCIVFDISTIQKTNVFFS